MLRPVETAESQVVKIDASKVGIIFSQRKI